MTTAVRAGLPAVVLLALAVVGVLLLRDVTALEPILRGIQDDLLVAATAVEQGDEETARVAIEDAAAGVAAAQERADGPLWPAAALVPRFGASAEAVTEGVALAAATVDLATEALEEALVLIDEGAAAFVGAGGRVDTSALAAAAATLDGLPIDPVRESRDRLASLPASGLVGPGLAARDNAVSRATAVIDQVARGRIGASVFGSFLGGEQSRTYLLGVQNNGELRGTGGLLSYLAEITVTDGAIDIRAIDEEGLVEDLISRSNATFGLQVEEPVDAPADFVDRYGSNAGNAIIQSANLDPDLPTVGPVLLNLYADRTGRTLDGIVLTDPFALEAILGATGGPLDVPDVALAEAPGLPATLTSTNAAQTLLIDVYDEFGGLNPARRDFDELVTLAVFQRLTSGGWEPATLARAMADAAAERHLQLFSVDPDEQAGFETLGIAGAMTDPGAVTDLLAVTGVNAGQDKSDVHVSHRISADIQLRARPGAVPWQVLRDGDITVEVDNPLRPEDHDEYITGTTSPAPVGEPSRYSRDALNRTWFTIWTPDSTRVTSLRDGVQGEILRTGSIHGHNAIDYFLETPSASTAAFSAPYTGPLLLEQTGRRYLYELLLWRQAKGIADVWDVRVTPPAGLVVDQVRVEGGGDPTTGLGPAEPQPLEAVVEADGTVRLTGSVTRDTTLKVWFVAG